MENYMANFKIHNVYSLDMVRQMFKSEDDSRTVTDAMLAFAKTGRGTDANPVGEDFPEAIQNIRWELDEKEPILFTRPIEFTGTCDTVNFGICNTGTAYIEASRELSGTEIQFIANWASNQFCENVITAIFMNWGKPFDVSNVPIDPSCPGNHMEIRMQDTKLSCKITDHESNAVVTQEILLEPEDPADPDACTMLQELVIFYCVTSITVEHSAWHLCKNLHSTTGMLEITAV